MTNEDAQLEQQIQTAYNAVLSAGSVDVQRDAFHVLAGLVARRSPERVAEMERERGLAR